MLSPRDALGARPGRWVGVHHAGSKVIICFGGLPGYRRSHEGGWHSARPPCLLRLKVRAVREGTSRRPPVPLGLHRELAPGRGQREKGQS